MNKENESVEQQKRLGLGMVAVMWLLCIGLLTVFFNNWYERQQNPNQSVNTQVQNNGVREVVLQRNRYGHYVATGKINGVNVTFMLDTGATDISVPWKVARDIPLEKGPAVVYQTANGSATNYLTRIEEVSLGDIKIDNVRASINPNVDNKEILLGMAFLKHLEFTQRGNMLTLRQYP